MTRKVYKSQIGPGFEATVAAHAKEMRDWREHMGRVAADERAGVTGINKHVPYHRPTHHPMILKSVNENDQADYVIIDDSPTPEEILESKKMALHGQLAEAERIAIVAIVPPAKARAFNLRENDINVADSKLVIAKPGILSKIKVVVGLEEKVSIMDEITKMRPAADTQFLAEQADRRSKVDAIVRTAASISSQIEDLTIDNIDAWKMPAFPTAQ